MEALFWVFGYFALGLAVGSLYVLYERHVVKRTFDNISEARTIFFVFLLAWPAALLLLAGAGLFSFWAKYVAGVK